MSVPRSRRKESKLEACHNFYKLRDEITELMLMDFGFSVEKYEKKIDRYAYTHRNAVNLDDLIARQRKRCESFYSWFIDKENDALLEIMRNIETEFTLGNSIFPSDTPAQKAEYIERRKHLTSAINWCFVLKQELHYIIRTLPVNINKYNRFDELITDQIKLYKGVRKASNRFLYSKVGRMG